MSAATPVLVHSKIILETMESAKENVSAVSDLPKENTCEGTEQTGENICTDTEQEPLKENIHEDVEADKVHDIPQEDERNDPAYLLRRKTNRLLDYLTEPTQWSFAFSCASLFVIPLMLCFDVDYMGQNLPLNVRNLWYTQAVVIITIISLNLLLAVLLWGKCKLVKFFLLLNYTLLTFYYVVTFIVYIATQPHDTQLAVRMFHITCAIAFPNLILCLSITKKPIVRSARRINV